jgi:methyl-accepting chemotaxis protein
MRRDVATADEMGELALGINAVVGKIQGIVGKVRESSLQLLSVASEIASIDAVSERLAREVAIRPSGGALRAPGA